MTDVNPNDLPVWLKILAALAVSGTWVWAIVRAVGRPFGDERWYSSFERCSDRVEKHLREKVFAHDYEAVKARDARIAALDRKMDANQDSITFALAAQKQMGEAIADLGKDMPRLAIAFENTNRTLAGLDSTLQDLRRQMNDMAEGHNQLVGYIEAISGKPAPARKPRIRKA